MQNYVPIVSRGHLNNQPHSLGLVDSKINPTHEPWVGMSPINLTVWGWYIETLKKFALLKSTGALGSACSSPSVLHILTDFGARAPAHLDSRSTETCCGCGIAASWPHQSVYRPARTPGCPACAPWRRSVRSLARGICSRLKTAANVRCERGTSCASSTHWSAGPRASTSETWPGTCLWTISKLI